MRPGLPGRPVSFLPRTYIFSFLPARPWVARPSEGPGEQNTLPSIRPLWYITPSGDVSFAAVTQPGPNAPREDSNVPSVEERVIEIVSENLGVDKKEVKRETSFTEDVGADSLDIVELVMELEEEFEITIPDDQAEKIRTVGEAIDYIEKEIAKK